MDEGFLYLLSDDLLKSRSSREGLIQQIVTYVRDGRTVTRKQWVRSEFADHAKKDEEEKKEAILRQQERSRKKHEREVKELREKQETKDKRAYKRAIRNFEEEKYHHSRNKKLNRDSLKEFKEELDRKLQQADNDQKQQQEIQDQNDKKSDSKKKKEKSAYDKANETRAQTRAENKIIDSSSNPPTTQR